MYCPAGFFNSAGTAEAPENVGTGSLTLSLAVYDGDGTLQDTYSFGFSDLSVSAF